MAGHFGYDTPTPVVVTPSTSNETLAARTAAANGTADGADIAAAEAAHEEQLAAERAAEELRVQRAVEQARLQIQISASIAVQEAAPQIVASAERVLELGARASGIKQEIIGRLEQIFPNINSAPWQSIGSKEYFASKYTKWNSLYNNTWPVDISTQEQREEDKPWHLLATARQKHILPPSVLKEVSNYLHQRSGTGGPWDTSYGFRWTDERWSWVSELGETLAGGIGGSTGVASIPDIGYFYYSPGVSSNIFSGVDFNSNSNLTAVDASSVSAGGAYAATYYVDNGWPHGWLTNLETAVAMLGYYDQTVDETFDDGRSGGAYQQAYNLFTHAAIDHMSRPSGDIETGLKSILDGNHSYDRSWCLRGEVPHETAGEGSWTGNDSPTNLLNRKFAETAASNAGTCGWANNQLALDTNACSYTVGATYLLYEQRPFGILRNGGVLQQGLYTGFDQHSSTQEAAGWQYKKEGTAAAHPTSHHGVANKLRADAERFNNIQRRNVSESPELEALQVTQPTRHLVYTRGNTTLKAEWLTENNIYQKLADLLVSVAGEMDGLMDELMVAHGEIVTAHKGIIKKTCEAVEENTDFDSDDDWWDFWDDWDDEVGEGVGEVLSDPLQNLSQTFIARGQTSVMFKEQCFLLSFISDLAISKKRGLDQATTSIDGTVQSPSSKRLPYIASENNTVSRNNNASLIIDGESYGFLNKLTQNPRLDKFYNILNHELSNLQPRIRLWKVEFNDDGTEREVEIKFDSHFSAADLDYFKSTAARGVGVGLKSFNFTYDGSNPFAVKKSIKANLKIFANTFSEILKDRPGTYRDEDGVLQNTVYKYSDLAMKTWNTAAATGEESADSETDGTMNPETGEYEVTPSECQPTFDLQEENTRNTELNFRLKAQVGYSMPNNDMSSMRSELREALSECFVTLNLTPTVHNFEIDDQGRVIFNLNYLAYIEQFFDQALFNVFSSSDIILRRTGRDLVMKYYNSVDCSPEQISQKKDDFAANIKDEQETAISTVISELASNDLIYYINLPYETINRFLSYGPHRVYDDVVGGGSSIAIRGNSSYNEYLSSRVDDALSIAFEAVRDQGSSDADARRGEIQAALLGNDPREADLAFFYLSDMVDLVMMNIEEGLEDAANDISNIEEAVDGGEVIQCSDKLARKREMLKAREAFKKFRLLLGPVEFTHPQARDGFASIFVSLGDIPISVKYFVEWLSNKMLQKDEVSYTLTKFLNDLINNLASNFLNNDSCFGYSVKQKTRLVQSAISSFSLNENVDSITEKILELQEDDNQVVDFESATKTVRFRSHTEDWSTSQLPILNPSGPSNSARTEIPSFHEYNFFVYSAGRVMPMELQVGNKEADESRGIFHYILGRDRGLVKNIKLTKTQSKFLAETRFESEGYQGLQQLRVVYDAQVDMFASVTTFPGTYIYIDPRGFAPEGSGDDEMRLTALGIGGYYMIVRSEHEFAEGKANSILHCKWVNQLDRQAGELQTQMIQDSGGTGLPQSRKCNIEIREPSQPAAPSSGGMLSSFFG